MKLIRFGEPGEEKPGIQLESGTRVEIPPGFGDYDEAFFGGTGLDELKEWADSSPSAPRRSIRSSFGATDGPSKQDNLCRAKTTRSR